MKRYALLSALVLAVSTVAWGHHITGIPGVPANLTPADSIRIMICGTQVFFPHTRPECVGLLPCGTYGVSIPNHLNNCLCERMTGLFTVGSGCHDTCPGFCWLSYGLNNSTSSTSSASTQTTGPYGNAVAQTAGQSISGGSSSTSSSFSQSTSR